MVLITGIPNCERPRCYAQTAILQKPIAIGDLERVITEALQNRTSQGSSPDVVSATEPHEARNWLRGFERLTRNLTTSQPTGIR